MGNMPRKTPRETCCLCDKKRDGSHPSYCQTCYRAVDRKRYRRDKAKIILKNRRHTLKRFYGMTLEDYDRLLAAQRNVCAICKRSNTQAGGRGKNLHVDHCHKTGKVRGLVCHPCNAAMGNAGDDPARLRELADYLENPPAP
jgi:hypothetical protein